MSLLSRLTDRVATRVARWSFEKAALRGRQLGRLAYRVDKRHRNVALRNLAHAFPDRDEAWYRQTARASFEQAGRSVVEMAWSAQLDRAGLDQVVEPDGLRHLSRALVAGKGALVPSAHFGNWELMGVVFPLLEYPLVSVARPLDDSDLDGVLYRLRTRTGAAILSKTNAVRGALRALRAGKLVVVLCDQNTLRDEAVFVPYFHELAATTPVIAHLHLRTGAPILPAFAVPTGNRYRLLIEPALETSTADRQTAITDITAAITARIEYRVRENPEAWLWMHDRWRERP